MITNRMAERVKNRKAEMEKNVAVIPVERIERLIFLIRGQRVMLDRHLAVLYGVSTKVLNQAVKRNKGRFPEDFMFQLTTQEARVWWADVMAPRLRSQNVTLKRGQHIKYAPYAFMEHGILMLSSVLNSERAVQVNIEIMRAFVRLRQVLSSHRELARKLEELERHLKDHDGQMQAIFDAIRQLMTQPKADRKKIGFHLKERHSPYIAKVKKRNPN